MNDDDVQRDLDELANMCGHGPHQRAERAVIEAARWLYEQVQRPEVRLTGHLLGPVLQLCTAIEALDAAEKEGA